LYEGTATVVINKERRHMSLASTFDGSLARTLDFGETTTRHPPVRGLASRRTAPGVRGPSRRRLGLLRGPDKYTVLDQRRRAAQIRARHAMDLIDVMERAGEGR
jgi:hypothetical protein